MVPAHKKDHYKLQNLSEGRMEEDLNQALSQSQEEGIQADDEDNDQIETERANYPDTKEHQYFNVDKRNNEIELQRKQQNKSALAEISNTKRIVSSKRKSSIARKSNENMFMVNESQEGICQSQNGSITPNLKINQQHSAATVQGSSSQPIKSLSSNPREAMDDHSPNNHVTGVIHPHPTQPDKLVTASGAVISRPKSKQQSKKQKLATAQSSSSQPHSKFNELRKMQSGNTKSNKALDALRSVNQKEMMSQQMQMQHQQIHNVKEEREEDEVSDGNGTPRQFAQSSDIQQSTQQRLLRESHEKLSQLHDKGQASAAQYYGNKELGVPAEHVSKVVTRNYNIGNQGGADYSNSQDKILNNKVKKRMETSSSPNGGADMGVFEKNKANMHMMRNTVGAAGYGFYQHQGKDGEGGLSKQFNKFPKQGSQFEQMKQLLIQRKKNNPQPSSDQNSYRGNKQYLQPKIGNSQNNKNSKLVLPSQIYQNTNPQKCEQQEDKQKHKNQSELTHSQEPHNDSLVKPQVNMKKFAVTSNNFYRTSHEGPNQPYTKDQGGSLQSRQIQNNNPSLNYYKQYGINLSGQAAAQASGSRDPRDNNSAMAHNQSRSGSKNTNGSQNPHTAYASNTAYGYRDSNRNSKANNQKQNKGTAFGDPARNAYNDQYDNHIEQQPTHTNPFVAGNQMRMGNHSMGRNTFYVSDYQLQKQSREFNNKSMGRKQKQVYNRPQANDQQNPIINHPAQKVSTVQSSYNLNQDQRADFMKPRAISRQADAHIRIEVHKDQRIIHHLQQDKTENMNLMFYNFNEFNNQPPSSYNGRRPTAGTSNGKRPVTGKQSQNAQTRTQTNFYKKQPIFGVELNNQKPKQNDQKDQKTILSPIGPAGNIHEQVNINPNGDRVPTRERQYRSAHQNRRRDITRQNYNQIQAKPPTIPMQQQQEQQEINPQ